MKCFRWSHLICFLFSVERWADSEPPSEKTAAEQHANGKLRIILIMIEPSTMVRRWLDDSEDDQYHDYDLVAIHESHNHRHHHHPRQIDMSRVHWLIEGSCLWYKHDSQKASSPIARVGWQANRDQWACASLVKYYDEDAFDQPDFTQSETFYQSCSRSPASTSPARRAGWRWTFSSPLRSTGSSSARATSATPPAGRR